MPPPSVRTAAWQLRGLMLCNAAYWFLNWIDSDALGAFWRSLVHCDSNDPPANRHSPDWSGSRYCTSKKDVIGQTTAFGGTVTLVSYIVRSPCLLALGAFADRYGRKRAALLSIAGWTVFGTFMALSSTELIPHKDKWTFILVGVAVMPP